MFDFTPAPWIPYRDKEVLERVRNIPFEKMAEHPNPNFKIRVVPNVGGIWIADMFTRIRESDLMDKPVVMLMPNPCPIIYETVAELINRFRVDCRNVYTFNLDEWADENGNIAPDDYKAGFNHSFLKSFYGKIDPDLRMKRENCTCFTNENIGHYSDLITERGNGGADVSYTGPGWAGHVAFVDPDTPEFKTDSIEEFMTMGARIVTLHPLTIAQNSLHGVFGSSGDLAAVPPKAATIGPADIVRCKNRIEMHDLSTRGSDSSWQRMISRLVLHAPPTPQVPTSFLQLLDATVYVSEQIAKPFEYDARIGY